MASELNRSAARVLRVFEALWQDGYAGKTLDQIEEATSIPGTTVWRLLKTLQHQGWVIELPVDGSRQGRWQVSTKLAAVASAYERHALARIQAAKDEYQEVTGKEFRV